MSCTDIRRINILLLKGISKLFLYFCAGLFDFTTYCEIRFLYVIFLLTKNYIV